jgi:hypothetical protein
VTTIAHQFKVSWGLIYQILRDERWTHVK